MVCQAPFWNHSAEVVVLDVLIGQDLLYKRGRVFEILFYGELDLFLFLHQPLLWF